MNPKVFVSHASEDKDRFVMEFAGRLRQRGVDAWVDRWEMLPGDSLVDKIFEEGIKEASGVIVVLSKFSVAKPWVREELNAAFVKRINSGSKLIPVVIDDCEVPEALKSTLWERIADLSSYDASLDQIVASIFGASDKPPLGPLPEYVKSFTASIGGMTNMDSLVLRLACEAELDSGEEFLHAELLMQTDEAADIPESEFLESLEILDQHGYAKILRVLGAVSTQFRITPLGFDAYAEACIPDYQKRITAVASAIVNEGLTDNEAIAQKLGEKQMMVDHILEILRMRGYIEISEFMGGFTRVSSVSPTLRRALRGG